MTAHELHLTAQQPVRLTIADFMLLDQNGAFDDYGKTELLDGDIYYMNAQHRRHARAKMELLFALHDALLATSSSWSVISEATIHLSDGDAPEPDIFLTSEPEGEGLYPGESIALIVEIADSTQAMDLGKKAMIYARAGVPEYWVLDTEAAIAHQLWAPRDTAYTQRREIALGAPISAETLSGLCVTLPR